MKRALMPLLVLMIWLALVFAAIFRKLRAENGPEWLPVLVLLCMGAFGVVMLVRRAKKALKDDDRL